MKLKNALPTRGTLIFLIIFIGAMALLNITGVVSIGSGIRVGWIEQKETNNWGASYFLFTGSRERRLNTKGTPTILDIGVDTTDGILNLKITDSNNNTLYSEDVTSSLSVQLDIVGPVTATVTAKSHHGSFNFEW